jgi:hypothetical protein
MPPDMTSSCIRRSLENYSRDGASGLELRGTKQSAPHGPTWPTQKFLLFTDAGSLCFALVLRAWHVLYVRLRRPRSTVEDDSR